MSRDPEAKRLAARMCIRYTQALVLVSTERTARRRWPHPLDPFAPFPVSREWIREVAGFARDFDRLLRSIRAEIGPDAVMDSEIVAGALERGLADDMLRT